MFRYGLKLWSTNKCYIKEAVRLYQQGVYSYIELFVVPDSFDEYADIWAGLKIPYIIHAPHYDKGVNLAQRTALHNNIQRASETLAFADKLKADTVIFHPGIEGDIRETAYQLQVINDKRIVVENKPHFGRNDVLCNGASPEEIEYLINSSNVGFCLDISHAICSANAKQIDPLHYLKRFIKLQPKMYHVSDGNQIEVYDSHDHIGTGTYKLREIISLLPEDSTITIETDKDFTDKLDDFEQDVLALQAIITQNSGNLL